MEQTGGGDQPKAEIKFDLPERIEDNPAFWLGSIATITKLERESRLTKVEAYKAVADVMKNVNAYQGMRESRALQLARILGGAK